MFALKLKAMMEVVVKKKLFGPVLAHVCRIEWQVTQPSAGADACNNISPADRQEECHMRTS